MEQYDELDMSELNFERNRLTPGKQQDYLANFVKLTEEDGYVIVRLLPPRKGGKLYCATRTHKMNGRNIHCPRTLDLATGKWKGDCPICDYYNYLWRQVDDLTKRGQLAEAAAIRAKARSIKPVERYYYNCIVRKSNPNVGQTPKNGPLILSIGKQLHTRIVKAIVGDKELDLEPLGNVTHPISGRDFKIIKKIVHSDGQKFPNYNESVFTQSPSILGTDEEVAEWLEKLHDIMALRKLIAKEDMQREIRIFEGVEQDPRSAFDTSLLDPSGQPTQSVVREHVAEKPKAPASVAAPSVDVMDLPDDMPEDDFIKELREMG